MTQTIEQNLPEAPAGQDLVVAIREVLAASGEPLTPSKLRALLPTRLRSEKVDEILAQLASSGSLHAFPKYRSQQDRFWDRPMPEHVAALLESVLGEGPLPGSELRRKLPSYAQEHFEAVVESRLREGKLHRHPKMGRSGDRYGVRPAEPKDYLRTELEKVFENLSKLGFERTRIREGALELLHEEEWDLPPKKMEELPPTERPETAMVGDAESSVPMAAAGQSLGDGMPERASL